MSRGVQAFQGTRLREARLARGLFKNALADMIEVSGTAIARYEDGIDFPQDDKLSALADKLNFSRDFFLRPPLQEELKVVHWRSRASETKSAREMTEQRMRWLCEIFLFLERELEFPAVSLPELDLPSDFRLLTSEDIERAAEQVRSAWGMKDQPIPNVVLALENAGVPVTLLDIPSEKQDGFCFRSTLLNRAFVGMNRTNASSARLRFDAAHELGHALLHRYVTPEQSRDALSHSMLEEQANRFAGSLIFPRDAFVQECRHISLDYFSALKKRWGMSIAAMIMRASDLQLIGKEERTTLFRLMTYRRWRGPLREPYDGVQEMPIEQPRMLSRAFDVLFASGIWTKASLLSSLAIPSTEVERLAGLGSGSLSDKSSQVPIIPRRHSLSALDVESGTIVKFPAGPKR